jgi:cytidylate kinase
MIDISPFPNNIGRILEAPTSKQILKTLPSKTIIRIFGIAGAGKGTLSKLLTQDYGLTNLETSYILRSATWIYKQLGLELTEENTKEVFGQIEIKLENKALVFLWNDEVLSDNELRSNLVQQNVSIYSGNPFFRSQYYSKISFILKELVNEPVILDGRGSTTPYLIQAQKDGYNIIRIFLWSDDEVSYSRYKSNFMSKNKLEEITKEQEQSLKTEFQKNILDRNISDYENAISNNLGLITQDTGILDTSDMQPQEVLNTAISFINSQIN